MPAGNERVMRCDRFIDAGFMATVSAAAAPGATHTASYPCNPPWLKEPDRTDRYRAAVVGWLSKHPEKLSEDLLNVLREAYLDIFQCKAGPT
jgi:hypothetical protein